MKQKRLTNETVDIPALKKAKPVKKKKKFTDEEAKSTWLSKPKKEEEEQVGDSVERTDTDGGGDERVYENPSFHANKAFDAFLDAYTIPSDAPALKQEAIQFFRRPTPYKGIHLKEYKGSIKEAGGKWFKNLNHIPGDWESKFGWYVACSLRDLKTMLRLPLTKDGSKAWHPLDLEDDNVHIVCRLIIEFVEEFEAHKEREEERVRALTLSQRDDKQKRLKQDAAGAVLNDTEDDIQRLVEKLSTKDVCWKYDSALIRASAAFGRLGPAMPTNAKRVLRALHLEVLTSEEVARGDFHGFDIREINTQRMKRERLNGTGKKERRILPQETPNPEKPKVEWDNFEKSIVYLKKDSELDELKATEDSRLNSDERFELWNQAVFAERSAMSLFTAIPKATTCMTCVTEVCDQFGCSCFDKHWILCRRCKHFHCDMQTCMCCFTDVEFPVETTLGGGKAEGDEEDEDEDDEEDEKGDETRAEGLSGAIAAQPRAASTASTTGAAVEASSKARKEASKIETGGCPLIITDKKRGKQRVRFIKLPPKYESLTRPTVDPDL